MPVPVWYAEALRAEAPPLPTPCFPIDQIELIDTAGDAVDASWAQYIDDLLLVFPVCLQAQDINQLVDSITGLMLEDGWLSVRLGIPNQDLNTGVLKLVLLVGRLDDIKLVNQYPESRWKLAVASKQGEPLNLRDMEQTVEQLERLASQKAKLTIQPGAKLGASDLLLALDETSPRIRTNIRWDNQGDRAINSNRWTYNLTMDHPLGLTDIFNLSSVNSKGQEGFNHGITAAWSIGVGYNTYKITLSDSKKSRRVIGTQQHFQSVNTSHTWQVDYIRRLYRKGTRLVDANFSGGFAQDRAFIDGTEIDVQRRNQAWAKWGVNMALISSVANWQIGLHQTEGKPGWGGDDDPPVRANDSGTHRYQLQTFSLSRTQKWPLDSGITVSWRSHLAGQLTTDVLLSTEQFSIGGASSVRGFNTSLTANKGWYWRNDLMFSQQQTSANDTLVQLVRSVALDIGEVTGPNVNNLVGTQLAGLAIDHTVRHTNWGYSIALGFPLYGPDTILATASPQLTMSVTGYF